MCLALCQRRIVYYLQTKPWRRGATLGLTLKVSTLKKSYGKLIVFDGCSYTFKDAGAYAIMGPNGSGKSTFLRMCALLERPDSGRIDFMDGDTLLDNTAALTRRITLLLPTVGVFNTTVYENVAYGLRIRKVKKPEIEEKVALALKTVSLEDKAKHRALTLSSGETQRMGLARALVISPDLLILDEPTAAVDAENSRAIEGILLNIKHSLKATIIFATHDTHLAESAADTILAVSGGLLAEIA